MKKIIGLVIIGMLSMGMVGCGRNKILQEQINIFEVVNEQKVNTNSIEEYCDSFDDIEGLKVHYYKGLDMITFEVKMNEDLYNQFQEDIREMNIKEVREKYNISELNEEMLITNITQQKIVDKINKDIDVECIVLKGKDRFDKESLVLMGIINEKTWQDKFLNNK